MYIFFFVLSVWAYNVQTRTQPYKGERLTIDYVNEAAL